MASDFSAEATIDPMNLTLPPDIPMDDDENQPDWSQFTNILMDDASAFKFPPLNDISSIQEDFFAGMDFNPAIDSDAGNLNFNATHALGNSIFTGAADYSAFANTNFPFTFQQNQLTTPHPRRLSITSSSSSSGGSNSLSPIMQPSATPVDSASPASSYASSDPADELAQRVIQSAGVLLAVPNQQHQQVQQHLFSPEMLAHPQPSFDSLSHDQLKAAAAAISAAAAARSAGQPVQAYPTLIAPSPSTIKSSPSPTPPPPEAGSSTAAASGARPRTSHTTIERRYRTNLNTRIQSLRLVVPALRVLDKKKVFPEDVVDDRGFVDGVKVARKCSKANVLGKAEEYIRVLKRREQRLVTEHNGLKALISGLVGGAALLREWEREWKAKYGGKEKDEVEGFGSLMEESDDEEGDGDEDDSGGDGEGRKRKKPKIAAPTANAKKNTRPTTTVDGQVVPEKRKRGRPRKVVPEPLPVTTPPPVIKPDPTARPAQQYLLAVFALFSFFNSSPSTLFSSKPEHGSHTGHVLSSATSIPHQTPSGWSSFIQSFHLLVSLLVFASIVTPWLPPSSLMKSNDSVLRTILSLVAPGQADSSPSQSTQRVNASPPPAKRSRAALLAALTPARRGSPDEVDALRHALGADPGFFIWNWSSILKETGFEGRGLEQRGWVRLGEIISLRRSTSFCTRLQTYWCMSKHVPQFGACVSDLVTLALVLYPIAPGRARAIWARAQSRAQTGAVRACERLAVENLSLDEAAKILSELKDTETDVSKSPVFVLARRLVTERLERVSKSMFVAMVLGADGSDEDEKETRVTVEAAKSLGGDMAEMGDALEFVSSDVTTRTRSFEAVLQPREGDAQALLSALLIYKQIFPSSSPSLSSASPSIVVEDPKAQLELRRILDEPVFDAASTSSDELLNGLVEDARDRAVDLLVEMERKARF